MGDRNCRRIVRLYYVRDVCRSAGSNRDCTACILQISDSGFLPSVAFGALTDDLRQLAVITRRSTNCFRVFRRIMRIHDFSDTNRTDVLSVLLARSLYSAPSGDSWLPKSDPDDAMMWSSRAKVMFYGWRIAGGSFLSQAFAVGFFTYAVSLLTQPVRESFDVSVETVIYSPTLGSCRHSARSSSSTTLILTMRFFPQVILCLLSGGLPPQAVGRGGDISIPL